jgi:pancreatic triacylglycerol lipase
MIILYCLTFFSIHKIDDPIEIAKEWKNANDNIDSKRDVKLLIHGWNADSEHVALETVRNSYLKLNTSHLLMADWRDIAGMRYFIARNLIRNLGKRICKLLEIFVDQAKIEPGRIHIVGHSLGAHIGTHVGRCFKGKIGR